MLSPQQLTNFKHQLQEMKVELEEHLDVNDHLGMYRSHPHDSVGELSSYDNHPADEATELYEREKDLALDEHYRTQYRRIEAALEAIIEGTYGTCIVCHREIPLERLEVLPTTLYCKEHSPDQVTSHDRPIEEGVLMPPFGKFDMDEQDENVAYDAEDSWQDVAKWGTSETPSDFADPQGHYNDVYLESDDQEGYVEPYENFVGVDITGKHITVYPNRQHEAYEKELDEQGTMTPFGDLPAYEHDAYVDDTVDDDKREK